MNNSIRFEKGFDYDICFCSKCGKTTFELVIDDDGAITAFCPRCDVNTYIGVTIAKIEYWANEIKTNREVWEKESCKLPEERCSYKVCTHQCPKYEKCRSEWFDGEETKEVFR